MNLVSNRPQSTATRLKNADKVTHSARDTQNPVLIVWLDTGRIQTSPVSRSQDDFLSRHYIRFNKTLTWRQRHVIEPEGPGTQLHVAY